MRETTDQQNSEHGYFSGSDWILHSQAAQRLMVVREN